MQIDLMRPRSLVLLAGSCLALVALPMSGCDKKAPTTTPAAGAAHADDHDHAEGDGHDHAEHADDHDHADDHAHGDDHGHGATVALGELVVDGMTIRASRDGDITPGGDVPIDVWVTGGTPKVAAVRFWVGTQDAKGSVKAKAELEKDNWHTHAEVPNPLPEASMLWVEVETDAGAKSLASFDLKM
jgi:hypothetical protein